MLDTDTCIYAMKGLYPSLNRRIEKSAPARLTISSITAGELLFGAEKSQHRDRSMGRLETFFENVNVAEFDLDAAKQYGLIRARLEARGKPLGPLDMQIAGHAVALSVTLVSHNTREFSRVAGLNLEDWTR